MTLTALVNATDLTQSADSRDGQEMLRRLVPRLAEQTSFSIRDIHFQSTSRFSFLVTTE